MENFAKLFSGFRRKYLFHKDKIRLGLYTQVVEKLLYGVVSTTCIDRSSPGFWEYLMRSNRPKQYCWALWTLEKNTCSLQPALKNTGPGLLGEVSPSKASLNLQHNMSNIWFCWVELFSMAGKPLQKKHGSGSGFGTLVFHTYGSSSGAAPFFNTAPAPAPFLFSGYVECDV